MYRDKLMFASCLSCSLFFLLLYLVFTFKLVHHWARRGFNFIGNECIFQLMKKAIKSVLVINNSRGKQAILEVISSYVVVYRLTNSLLITFLFPLQINNLSFMLCDWLVIDALLINEGLYEIFLTLLWGHYLIVSGLNCVLFYFIMPCIVWFGKFWLFCFGWQKR